MRKMLIIFVIGILASAAYGEEASVLPEGDLRFSVNESAGYAEGEPLADFGLGVEYAPSDWLNLQLLWNPRFHPDPSIGNMYVSLKGFLLGEGALASAGSQWLRLSAALGILIPPPDKQPNLRDQTQDLWGSALRLYSDFLFGRYFYINLYAEGIFYPPQYVDNEVFYGDWVRHYIDLTGELELRFEAPLKNGFVLKWGAPARFFYAPYMNAADEYAGSQYLLSAGGYFGIKLPDGKPPFELYLKYSGGILGRYVNQAHRASLIFKFTFAPGAKDSE